MEVSRWVLAAAVGVVAVGALAIVQAQAFAAVLSVAYAIVGEVAATWLLRHLNTKAALVQEQFDRSLFDFDWTSEQAPLSGVEIARLGSKYRGTGEELRDWYLDVSTVPVPFDRALCQRQTLTWDLELRQDWSWRLTAVIAGYLALAYVVGLILGMTVATFSIWLVVPALPALVALASSVIQHRESISTRRKALWLLDTVLDSNRTTSAQELPDVCQSVQALIFAGRCAAPRVPDWFYHRRRDAFELGSAIEASAMRSRWAGR